MSQDNEIKSDNNQSTIKNLFKQSESSHNQDQYNDAASDNPSVIASSTKPHTGGKAPDYPNPSSQKPKTENPEKKSEAKGFWGRIRSVIGSMKQSPDIEPESEDDDYVPAKKRSLIQMLKIESYEDSSDKDQPSQKEYNAPVIEAQTVQQETQEFSHEPQNAVEYNAPVIEAQPVQQEIQEFSHEQQTAKESAHKQNVELPPAKAVKTEQPSAQSAETDFESENVIYSSVKKADSQPSPEASSEKQKNDRLKKELPAFDIFEEFAKEQKKKGESVTSKEKEKSSDNRQKPEAVYKNDIPSKPDKTLPDTVDKKAYEPVDVQLADKEANQASENQKQSNPSYDKSKKDDKKIIPLTIPNSNEKPVQNVIYDGVPNQKRATDKDLSEGYVNSVTYHYSTAVPVIVMAGKFSKTLRTEYEAVKLFRATGNLSRTAQKNTQKPADASFQRSESQKIQKSAPDTQNAVRSEARKSSVSAHPFVPEITPRSARSQEQSKAVTITLKQNRPAVNKQDSPVSLNDVISSGPPVREDKPAVKEKKTSFKIDRHKAAKAEKEKKKIRISYLFNSEEDYDPDDDINRVVVPKPVLEDYNEESDAEAISTEISTNFQTVFARTIVLLAATVASLVLALLGQCTTLFSQTIRNGWLWFAIIGFVFFAVSVFVSRSPILNGLSSLKHFKGNSDTAVAVASVAAAMQSFSAMFSPDVYLNGKYYIYTSLVSLALLCNSLGKLLIITRTHYNFSFLTKPYPKYAGKIYTDKTNAEKMSAELPTHRAIIGYTKRSGFMSNFLQLSYAPDPSEDLAGSIAPWTALISVLCGAAYGLLNMSFLGGLASFALTSFISIPIISLLAVNIPLRRLCKNSLKGGAMVTSYETVKQFCDTNAIMIDSSMLYPKGSVTLSGMKSFKQSKLNEALLSGAAIMDAVNGTMIHVFENIVQCSKEQLPKVENVIYEDGRGLVGWVNGQRVLIGNRELLESHNIEPPEKDVEERYLAMGNEITYISVSGELIAMFILSYKTNKNIAIQLKKLEQDGVCFIVRTVDANLSREMVARNFGLFYRCITILPTNLGNICHEAITSVDERSRAYLVTRGKLSSFARAVSGCIRIKSNVTISKILQCVAMAMGLAIVTLISFVSGFEKLGCLEMLIYTGFWSVTTIIATMIRK